MHAAMSTQRMARNFPCVNRYVLHVFPDGVRHGGHAGMHGQIFRLYVLQQTERRTDETDNDANVHQHCARHAAESGELDGGEVGDVDVRFAGVRTKRQAKGEKKREYQESCSFYFHGCEPNM